MVQPELDRLQLNHIFADALRPNTIAWGCGLRSVLRAGEGFELSFDGDSTARADVVVDASGARTLVRSFVGAPEPEFSGTVGVGGQVDTPRADCPELDRIVNGGNLIVRGEGKNLFIHTMANGGFHYYMTFRRPQTWLKDQGLRADQAQAAAEFLVQQCATWAPLYHQGLRASSVCELLAVTRAPVLQRASVSEAVTLIGDAAHAMTPFAGMGVNCALLDAVYLADALTDGTCSNVCNALKIYEDKMYAGAAPPAEQGAQTEAMMHSDISLEEVFALFGNSEDDGADGE